MKKLIILFLVVVIWIVLIVFVFDKFDNKADVNWIDNKFLNIQYASDSNAQKLDIYYPNEGSVPFPVIIFIHGGAFKFGDKADKQLKPALEGLHRGYAVVSINYRLSGEAKWPAQINDVKAAIKFIRANAEVLNLKGDKIAVWGASAGGNLAALAGTSGGLKALVDPGLGFEGVSDTVQAVVDWFGPVDFLKMDEQWKVLDIDGQLHSGETSYLSQLMGEKITRIPQLVKTANPIYYIDGDEPPFFIQCGTGDKIVPYLQSKEFADALREKSKNEVVYESIKGAGHADKEFESKANLDKIFDFLDRHLK